MALCAKITNLIQKSLCDVLSDLVPFVQFKKREKHPRRSATFSTKSNTPPWVFFMILNCTNDTKSHNAWFSQKAPSQISDSVSNTPLNIFISKKKTIQT